MISADPTDWSRGQRSASDLCCTNIPTSSRTGNQWRRLNRTIVLEKNLLMEKCWSRAGSQRSDLFLIRTRPASEPELDHHERNENYFRRFLSTGCTRLRNDSNLGTGSNQNPHTHLWCELRADPNMFLSVKMAAAIQPFLIGSEPGRFH